MSQISNYWTNCQATPKKDLTTTDAHARQFHHNPSMHGTHYNSNTFVRDQFGNMVGTTMLVVRDFWDSLGERHCTFSTVNLLVGNTIPFNAYTKALQRGLGQNVECKPFQVKAFTAIDDVSTSSVKHVFVFIRPGDGKSTLWNVPPLARYMHGYKPFKYVVVLPENAKGNAVENLFDPVTGEVSVAGISVPMSVWSNAIPNMQARFQRILSLCS